VLGFEEAIRRANAALEAGAGMAFVEAPETREEVAAVPRLVKGPCLLNLVWRGKTPDLSLEEAEALGYKIAILPALLFTAVIGACDRMLDQLHRTRRHPVPDADLSPQQAFRRFGANDWQEKKTDAS
jgi:2-methylisocitrate lyase-like PEP mutase family enzyme